MCPRLRKRDHPSSRLKYSNLSIPRTASAASHPAPRLDATAPSLPGESLLKCFTTSVTPLKTGDYGFLPPGAMSSSNSRLRLFGDGASA
jgi:hypothetical protein